MVRRVRAGARDQLVSLQRIERAPDGGGGWTEEWVELGKAWASIRPLTGRERVSGEQQEMHIGYEISVPYREDLDAGMAVLWKGRRLGVVWIADAGARAGTITLTCGTGEG